jgi:Protein of unknown function (DUF3352)
MSRLRSVLNGLRNLGHGLALMPRAIGDGFSSFWTDLSPRTRRRLGLAVLGGAAAVLLLALAVPALPCQFPAGDVCPPDDDAEEIVPGDVLGYAHLSLDPDSDQYEAAAAIVDEVPRLARQGIARVVSQVPGPGGSRADFDRDIAPWFGGQAAVAIVPKGGGAEQVQLLEEGDSDRAAEFADSLSGGAPQTTEYRGIEVARDERGLATASVGGFLVIGTDAGVRRVIDVDTGAEGARPLADDELAADIRDDLPPERFADAYLSEDGIARLVADESGPLASLEPVIDAGSSRAAAISVGAGDDGVELAARSALDRERAEANPGFFAAFPRFEPELPDQLGAEALAYVGIAEPATTVRELLAQATGEAPALAEGFTSLTDRVRDLGRVNVEEELLPTLAGEAAFALQPGPQEKPPAAEQTTTAPAPEGLPEAPSGSVTREPPVPILQFLANGVDAARARNAIARLQGSIAKTLDPSTALQAPTFDRGDVDGIAVQTLSVSPTVNLTYAVAGTRLVVATQPDGVAEVIRGEGGLAGADAFERATEGLPDEVSLEAYLDLAGLVGLGEREGLAEDPAYAAFAPDIGRLESLGLAISAEPDSISTDARVVIAEGGSGAASE